jgi:transposase
MGSTKPTQRRYTQEQKDQAVRLVRQLRAETGQKHGAVQRVAAQLGYGVESVRAWVTQADIDDGARPGVTSTEAERIKVLEQEVRELRRANEMAGSTGERIGAVRGWPKRSEETVDGRSFDEGAEAAGVPAEGEGMVAGQHWP